MKAVRPASRPALACAAAPCSLALLVAVLAACALLGALAVPAHAAEGVTREIAGVAYTLPADWEQVEVPAEAVDAMEGARELAMFHKDDGFFVAMSFGEPGTRGLTLEEMEELAGELGFAVAQMPAGLTGVSLSSLAFSAALEQGFPTLTVYTDDLELNGVVYGLTAKLVSAGTLESATGVLAVSLLPVSGLTTPDFADSFPILEQPQRMAIAGASYELPAGTRIVEGSALGLDFLYAARGEAGLLALMRLSPALGLYAANGEMLDELQLLADELMSSVQNDPQAAGLFDRLWAGAYIFAGMPTLGLEVVCTPDGQDSWYAALNTSFTDDGIALVGFAEPLSDGFAQEVLASAEALDGGPEDAFGTADAFVPEDERGFVIGVIE